MTTVASNYNVELRDKDGNLKTYLTPFITSLTWEWQRIGGCGDSRIKLAMPYRNIDFVAGDDIQIRIKTSTSSKLVYRGYIVKVVPIMQAGQNITLYVKGYFERLKVMIIHDNAGDKIYSNKEISEIVDDIVDNFIVTNSDITKGTINTSSFSVDTLTFKTNIASALSTCAELLGNVEYGVDEDLVFFWYNQDDTVQHRFFVGDNISKLERSLDWTKLINKIYFEGGEVDGVKYTTSLEASDSQSMYFVSESIISNTSINTQSVADQYITAKLKEYASPKIISTFEINNTDYRLEDSLPIGKVSVYDKDYDTQTNIWGTLAAGGSGLTWGTIVNGGSGAVWGSSFAEQVKKITYTKNNSNDRFNIKVTLGEGLLETSAQLKRIDKMLDNIRQVI